MNRIQVQHFVIAENITYKKTMKMHSNELINRLYSRKLEIVLEVLTIVRALDAEQIKILAHNIKGYRDPRYWGESCDLKPELYESMTLPQIARMALAIIRQDADLEEQLQNIQKLDDDQLHKLAEIMIDGEVDAARICRSQNTDLFGLFKWFDRFKCFLNKG